MASVCTNLPRSGGKYLDSEDSVFGCLEDSSYALDNPDELRGRLEANGYLYLKQFFPWKDVLKVRKEILALLVFLSRLATPHRANERLARQWLSLPKKRNEHYVISFFLCVHEILSEWSRERSLSIALDDELRLE